MLDACTGCCKNWLRPGSSIPGHSDVVTVASTGTDGDGDHPHVDLAFGPCMWTLHVDIVCYLAAHKQRESVHDGGHVINYWSRRHAGVGAWCLDPSGPVARVRGKKTTASPSQTHPEH